MISLKEIAKMAGVDVSTVSRALNDSPRVKHETKEMIKNLAREHNYIPDDLARGLVGKRTYTVGIIIPEFINTFYAEIIDGIESVLDKEGYTMLFGKTGFLPADETRYLDMFLRKRVDGIIACSVSKEFINQAKKHKGRIPVVLADTYLMDTGFDTVSIDNAYGVQMIMQFLMELGHRDIGFISDRIVTQERLRTYKKMLEKHGIPIMEEYMAVGKERYEHGGFLRMKELLALKNKPTAVFAVTDNMAIGAMRAARESGLHVPEDISIVGFDDIMVSSYTDVPLTTVLQPKFEIGKLSSDLLLTRIDGGSSPKFKQQVVLKPELVVRKTAAKALGIFQGTKM